ncbi:MAG: leucyl aminopeptidase [Desulfotignum sp.]|nr:leucyl aminopeptidase [Desulfotignum sp.]
MKNTRWSITKKPVDTIESDLAVYFAFHQKNRPPLSDPAIKTQVEQAFALNDFTGKTDDQLLYYPAPENRQEKPGGKRILVLGLDTEDKDKNIPGFLETLRKRGGDIAKTCEKTKAGNLAVCLPQIPEVSLEKTAEVLAEGILLGDYRFGKYRQTTRKETDYSGIESIHFSCNKETARVQKGLDKAGNAAAAACAARDMANEPGNGWTPKEFADYARALADDHGLKYTCLDKKAMKELGMGGILGVNQGSATPPCLVILEYDPGKNADTLLLVGKGLTFDSGGISIKPAAGMEEMKYDMCGGAAVLAAMSAVAVEKPDLRVVAMVPATDNMPGGSALRPGDIIRHVNQVTSEVMNTDAEGRLILADALAHGIKTYQPDCVVDIATLTGAVIIGLGHHYTGMISNNDDLARRLESAGQDAGEPVWRLPLNEDYIKQIESKVADIKNTGGKPGGTITAAAYLSKFVGDTPWAHLDIAGTAWDFTKKSYIPKGPSGTGVRTFIHLIRSWEKWPAA